MPDGDFVAEVAEAADCGILLDLHNVLCNARNGRQSVEAFCDAIPLDRVWEIHLAGGVSERGFWLDAHSGLVEPVLMDLVADLIPRLPALGAIIFEIMPEFIPATGLTAIGKVLGQLNDLWSARPSARSLRPIRLRRESGPETRPNRFRQSYGNAPSETRSTDLVTPLQLRAWKIG